MPLLFGKVRGELRSVSKDSAEDDFSRGGGEREGGKRVEKSVTKKKERGLIFP